MLTMGAFTLRFLRDNSMLRATNVLPADRWVWAGCCLVAVWWPQNSRLSMVLRLRQHNIGYTADGFYRSDDPTNSVKALKEGG